MIRALFFGDVPHRLAGAQKSLLLSLSRLAEHGVEPVVAFPHGGRFEQACRQAGLEVRIVESPPAFQSFGKALMRLSVVEQLGVITRQLLPFGRRLASLAEKERADVLHFNTPRGITMAGSAATFARLPCAMHLRGVPAISRAYWVPAQAIGDSFVLVARALEPYFAPSARPRTRVVYNGVELRDRIPKPEARAALARQLAGRGIVLPEGASLVVSVSSPTPFKGLHHLLDALRALVRKGRDVVVLCAGSGSGEPYEAWLQGRVAASGAGDRFVFLGFWDRVQELLSAADVTVVPSVQEETLEMDGERLRVRGTEGLPRAVLESLAAGVPVVASDVAGVREQIDDGRTGYVVPPGDVLALSSALERVLVDGAWRAAAGEAGREVVSRRFTIDGAAKGLAVVLEDLAARPPSAAERFGRLARLGWDIAARGAYSVNT